jgi:CRISPR/Cas system-associated exonuclease Cas4 (RecB family)
MDGVRLRGSIDLIEYDESRKVLRITDHKTGKLPQARLQFIGNGEILQPLLYGWAAESLLGIPVESGRLYYCTQRGEFQQQSVLLNDLSRHVIQQVTGTIDQAIARGFLPAAPRRDACQNCDYHLVCGPYEEIRIRSKPGKELEPLEEIRRIS